MFNSARLVRTPRHKNIGDKNFETLVLLNRDGKSRSGPRAYTGRNGPNDFLFKINLFIVRWALGSNKGIIMGFVTGRQEWHYPLNLKHNSIMGLAPPPIPGEASIYIYIYIYIYT